MLLLLRVTAFSFNVGRLRESAHKKPNHTCFRPNSPRPEAGSNKVAGIQQLGLGDHNISLLPELTYQWSVTMVADEGSRSAGVIASGLIERMEPGEGLTSRIKRSKGTDLVDVYANEGVWYDALETISSMIEESPEDKGLEAIRASLLDQVGLQTVAGNQ